MVEIFALTMPLWEIVVRATVVYVVVIMLVRFIPKRNAGHISPNDMLALIVIGTLGTDAIIGGSTSVGDILLMIVLIVGWGYVFDLLEYRVPWLSNILRHPSTPLIERGRFVRRNMRRELVTEEELMAALRKEGVDDVAAVHAAFLEADGEISVILKDGSGDRPTPKN